MLVADVVLLDGGAWSRASRSASVGLDASLGALVVGALEVGCVLAGDDVVAWPSATGVRPAPQLVSGESQRAGGRSGGEGTGGGAHVLPRSVRRWSTWSVS